jgi:hypothetical protein
MFNYEHTFITSIESILDLKAIGIKTMEELGSHPFYTVAYKGQGLMRHSMK